jgi:hypothetical protein
MEKLYLRDGKLYTVTDTAPGPPRGTGISQSPAVGETSVRPAGGGN